MKIKLASYLLLLLILAEAIFSVYLIKSGTVKSATISTHLSQEKSLPEIKELANQQLSFDQLKLYFQKLSKNKGAAYAFEVLKVAPMPVGTDMHLLGHVVGDELYKQQGVKGMAICTQDFRNACSHSIVVGMFTDFGDVALDKIRGACAQAPGGVGAYSMCYHGLGHGILAFYGYDFDKAVFQCNKTGTAKFSNQEVSQCVSGAVMELISGGGHDKEAWAQKRPLYLNSEDPFAICYKSTIPAHARPLCLSYLTPFLWESVGGDINNPQPADYQKSFPLCEKLTNPAERDSCYGGFGKEFVAVANGRDIRSVEVMDSLKLQNVYDLCLLAPTKQAVISCSNSVVDSLYWGGENSFQGAVNYCGLVNKTGYQGPCFDHLTEIISYYKPDPNYFRSYCAKLPKDLEDSCQVKLQIKS